MITIRRHLEVAAKELRELIAQDATIQAHLALDEIRAALSLVSNGDPLLDALREIAEAPGDFQANRLARVRDIARAAIAKAQGD